MRLKTISEALSGGLTIDEYIEQVCDKLLDMFDDKIKKYVDLNQSEMEKMISGHEIEGEWTPNYPDQFKATVEELWEDGTSLNDAIDFFAPGVKALVNGHAGVM